MLTPIIPWHVFLDALEQQQQNQMIDWLDRWRFTNDGVFMARDSRGTGNKDQSVTDASNRRRSEDRVLH